MLNNVFPTFLHFLLSAFQSCTNSKRRNHIDICGPAWEIGIWLHLLQCCQESKLHSFLTFSSCPACNSLLHLDMGSCAERSSQRCKVIPNSLEPLHLLWMKSALHPSSGPPTDASCSCTLLPVCTQTLLSEDVATAKLGHWQNLNGAALNGSMLVGWQKLPVSMVLFLVPPVNLNISAVSCSEPGWWSHKHKKVNSGSSCFHFGYVLFVLLHIVGGKCCSFLSSQVSTTLADIWEKQSLLWFALIGSTEGGLWLRAISIHASTQTACLLEKACPCRNHCGCGAEVVSQRLPYQSMCASWSYSRGNRLRE